ncbi:MAG: cytochrome c [Candidatus Eutrophobiaceae bacterium]
MLFLAFLYAPIAFSVQPTEASSADDARTQESMLLKEGQRLHNQHCTRCHSVAMYTRKGRAMNSLVELRERVQHCELGEELTWFEEETEAVAYWLNETYYHF